MFKSCFYLCLNGIREKMANYCYFANYELTLDLKLCFCTYYKMDEVKMLIERILSFISFKYYY